MPITSNRRRQTTLVAIIYTLLAILMTWPLVAQLGSAIPGKIGDAYVHLWTFSWLKQALLTGQNPFFTNLIFYPNGVSLLNHNLAWVNFAVWLPVQAIVGEASAYSLTFMAIFVFNALAVYWLARELIGSARAAFVAGLIGGFWPYNLSHHGHPNLILVGWLPLHLLFLRRAFTNRRAGDTILAALFLALLGLTRWQLLFMSIFAVVLFGLRELVTDRTRRWERLKKLLFVGGIAFLLMAPLLLPVMSYQLTRTHPEDALVEEAAYGADLMAYIVPGRYHPLWGEQARPFYDRFVGSRNYVRSIGYVTSFLILLGMAYHWRQTRFWLLMGVVYLLLALGPELYVNGVPTIPLPYRWIQNGFLFQMIRFPDRFNVVLSLPVALLAGFGAAGLLRLPQAAAWATPLLALLALLIVGEYAVSYSMLPLATPDWYGALAQMEGTFGIADVPGFSNNNDRYVRQYMAYQLTHGKPLAEGRIARVPREAFAFVDSVPLLSHLRRGADAPVDLTTVSHQLQLLHEANLRFLVVHKAFLTADQAAAWKKWLVVPPYYEDAEVVVYETDTAVLNRDVFLLHELAFDSQGSPLIGLIAVDVVPETAVQGQWVTIEAVWGSVTAVKQDYKLCLQVGSSGPRPDIIHCQPLAPDWPTSRWQANEIVRAAYQFQLDPFITSGRQTISMTLVDDNDRAVGQPVNAATLEVAALPRVFTAPALANQTNATWNNEISLLGYEYIAGNNGDVPDLTLYWQAEQRVEKSYKIFVHLTDSAGSIAAQIDLIPRNWTYPTNWWEQGEIIADTFSLPINGLAPGEYDVWVGLYDPDTGERLWLMKNGMRDNDVLRLTMIVIDRVD